MRDLRLTNVAWFVWGCGVLLCILPGTAYARRNSSNYHFGVARGLTFYTSSELDTINSRLGNSPRLTVDNEFGRALTLGASYEFLNKTESTSWGFEAQQWAETLRGHATAGGEDPSSEATLAFLRLWFTAGVRMWPWVGPIIIKRNTNLIGRAVVMSKARSLSRGLFSYLRVATGPLLWRHDYALTDAANQTAINYMTRSLAWEGGIRWTLGYRLGRFCDVGLDVSASRSVAIKDESVVGQFYLSGRDQSDQSGELATEQLSRSAWRTTQGSVFVRFFYP